MVSFLPRAHRVASASRQTANLSKTDSRLYSFSPETKEHLRKFRLTTSRAKDPQAIICTALVISFPTLPRRGLLHLRHLASLDNTTQILLHGTD